MEKKHYFAIDGLRTFSAIGIILMHVLVNGHYRVSGVVFESLIPSCTNLVFLFMVISGFAMCCGYYNEVVNNKISLEKFYTQRYKKIWPFFATLCLLDLIISPSFDSICEVFANLTLCFGLLDRKIEVIGVGWFLGVVFLFYMMFPFFCYLLLNKRRAWFSLIVAIVMNGVCQSYFEVGRTNLLFCAAFFFAGGLIYLYRLELERIAEKYHWFIFLLCAIMTIAYYMLGASVILMIILFSMYLVYAIGVSKEGILQNTVTRFLSSISMEMYLGHMVIYRALEKAKVTHLFGDGLLSYVFTSVTTLAGVVVFSIVVQKGLKKINSRRKSLLLRCKVCD